MAKSLPDPLALGTREPVFICVLLNVLIFSFLILAPSSLTSSHIPLGCMPGFPGSLPPHGAVMHPTHVPHTSGLRSQTHMLAVSPFWPLHSLVRHFFLIRLGAAVWFEMDLSVV